MIPESHSSVSDYISPFKELLPSTSSMTTPEWEQGQDRPGSLATLSQPSCTVPHACPLESSVPNVGMLVNQNNQCLPICISPDFEVVAKQQMNNMGRMCFDYWF